MLKLPARYIRQSAYVARWLYIFWGQLRAKISATISPTWHTVYPKKYAHGFCFAVLCCGYTLTDFPISIRLTSLALWQSNDCPSASKATLMNMDKYFMWIHCERLHNHNKAKHNKTACIFPGIYCRPYYATYTLGYKCLHEKNGSPSWFIGIVLLLWKMNWTLHYYVHHSTCIRDTFL